MTIAYVAVPVRSQVIWPLFIASHDLYIMLAVSQSRSQKREPAYIDNLVLLTFKLEMPHPAPASGFQRFVTWGSQSTLGRGCCPQ